MNHLRQYPAARHRPDLVVADLGMTFVDRLTLVPTVVARDLATPVRVQLESDTATMPQRLIACLNEIGVGSLNRIPVCLPLHAGADDRTATFWCQVVQTLGGQPVVMSRALAAAASFGLETAARAYLMVEGGAGVFESAALVDGEVVASRTVRSIEGGWRTMLDSLVELLRELDPDDELEVRDHGAHVFGPSAGDAVGLLEMAGLRVAVPVGDVRTVARGSQLIARDALPALWAI